MRVFLLILCCLAVLWYWTAPDREAASLSSPFKVGERSTNLLYMVATRGFDVVRVANGQAEYVRGDKRGKQAERFFRPESYPYGRQVADVCQGESCEFFAAIRTDRPFGSSFELTHTYKIGWVERDHVLQAIGVDNRAYFYPIK